MLTQRIQSVLHDRCTRFIRKPVMTLHEPKALRSLTSITLELPPSCIEISSAFPDLFVVGTYYLEQQTNDQSGSLPQERRGSLLLFRLAGQNL